MELLRRNMDKTKANLLKIAEQFGMNSESLVAMIKRQQLTSPFNPDSWDKYVEAITRLPPCPICGGPQKIVRVRYKLGTLWNENATCLSNKHHMMQKMMAYVYQKKEKCSWEKAVHEVSKPAVFNWLTGEVELPSEMKDGNKLVPLS
jgi:hypothetical protein